MKLFCKAGACSLSPHIVMRECGLDFTQVNVDLAKKSRNVATIIGKSIPKDRYRRCSSATARY